MQIHSLEIDDFSSDDYTLIGIHTTLEDYKLAYVLNKQLSIKFKTAQFSLDFTNKNYNATFPVYEYSNKKLDRNWFLISNTNKQIATPLQTGLFKESDTTTYLISEKKKVDFFIKLEGDFDADFITKAVEEINQIKQVVTSYTIEVDTLKSKEFLIF